MSHDNLDAAMIERPGAAPSSSKAGCPEIELHRYFSTCTNKQQAHFLDQAIYDAIPRAEWTDVAGFSVPVLPPLENGLVLLAHVNQHLGSGLGLRQILDWQMFVDAHLTDELWERGFQSTLSTTRATTKFPRGSSLSRNLLMPGFLLMLWLRI